MSEQKGHEFVTLSDTLGIRGPDGEYTIVDLNAPADTWERAAWDIAKEAAGLDKYALFRKIFELVATQRNAVEAATLDRVAPPPKDIEIGLQRAEKRARRYAAGLVGDEPTASLAADVLWICTEVRKRSRP